MKEASSRRAKRGWLWPIGNHIRHVPMRSALSTAGKASAAARIELDESVRDAGVVVAGWRVVRHMAEGRFTKIYRGAALDRDCGSAADYVLKLLRPEQQKNSIARAELAREAAVSREVEHPRLTTVFSVIDRVDSQGLVMPWLDGTSLAELIAGRRGFCWPIGKALWIARQVAEALAAMHDRGWMHGQVQPRHILLSPHGHVTLIDLSQASRFGSPECGGAELPRQPIYAAPEQCGGGRTCSAASDVYSLGIVLYALLAGRPPFDGSDPTRLLAMHRHALPEDIRYLRLDVSLELAWLLRRMLMKEPLRRPASRELVRWLTELEIAELALAQEVPSFVARQNAPTIRRPVNR